MSTKLVLSFIMLFFLFFGAYQLFQLHDGKLHIVICDVGQGDAIYFRTPQGFDVLFDGGPDTKVLDCLTKYKPFWERDIDVVILSHPHADHLNGLIEVVKRYQVKSFVTENLRNDSGGFQALEETLRREKVRRYYVYRGDSISFIDGVRFLVLSPDSSYLQTTSDNGVIRESGEFSSLILLSSYKEFDMLLTGDTQQAQLATSISSSFPSLEFLQVPHHGSRTGLTESLLKRLLPNNAVISVGKNKYGHPSPYTLGLLSNLSSTIHRTDKKGDIKVKTDGKTYNIE